MATTPPSAKVQTHLLTLIRHAETVANVAHILQGSTDSPLSVHGQNQVTALVKAVKEGRQSVGSSSESRERITPLFGGSIPTEIWSSPLPRTWKLASAICEAFSATDEENEVGIIKLVARSSLEEKSFGNRECSRGGIHVSGFPVGVKPMEDAVQFRRRVKEEGKALIDKVMSESDIEIHLVVVSHGLWISSFCDLFLPPSIRLPFADNTGVFTFAIEKGMIRVVCANDISHLYGLKRQRGGIGSSASDKKQRTLADMWTKT